MRILLIGKYPPCQGGIAARYYWLYRGLSAAYGWRFSVVTMPPPLYTTPDVQSTKEPEIDVTTVLPVDESRPWTLPTVDLAVERLLTAAVEVAEIAKPDLVECNYLAPYGVAALCAAQYFRCPLVIRPAGSDLMKLLNWPATRQGLLALLRSSAAVLLPPRQGFELDDCRVVCVPRYVPDPKAFAPSPPPLQKVLAVTGKINYYWRLRALDSLVDALATLPDWHLSVAVGGAHRSEFCRVLKGLDHQRYTLEGFVPTQAVPGLFRGAWAIWNAQRLGGISDFPNTHWEALASGRYSLVSPSVSRHPDIGDSSEQALTVEINPEDPNALRDALTGLDAPAEDLAFLDLGVRFEDYLNQHRDAYEGTL